MCCNFFACSITKVRVMTANMFVEPVSLKFNEGWVFSILDMVKGFF